MQQARCQLVKLKLIQVVQDRDLLVVATGLVLALNQVAALHSGCLLRADSLRCVLPAGHVREPVID